MLPEAWRDIRRGLFLGFNQFEGFNQDDASFTPLIAMLRSSCANLPTAQFQLLMLQQEQYQFLTLNSGSASGIHSQVLTISSDPLQLIAAIRSFAPDVAVILTTPLQSPFSLAYLCYLAGVPVRLGQSREFGGGVLSQCVAPAIDPLTAIDYHLYLLRSINFPVAEITPTAIA